MKSFKQLMNSLSNDSMLRELNAEETLKLRKKFIEAYTDLKKCCDKHQLTVMLIGGTVLGAVRHRGFIPWDDDLDVAMPRSDFEKLKRIFKSELGEKYILSSPNYKNNAKNRFPMMLIKNTVLVEAGMDPKSDYSKIKIDIFIIENIPDNKLIRYIKGMWCSLLMLLGSCESIYEEQNEALKNYLCKTKEGESLYKRRMIIGKMFSFFSFNKWMNIIDSACQYKKQTSYMGIPTGRGHYFKEIRPVKTFLPVSKGKFEGLEVNIPGNADDYLRNLYGNDYMKLPPVEKRERHFVIDIKFEEK